MEGEFKFTSNWFTNTCFYWPQLFERLGWDPLQEHVVIEIGSYEGQSTCWILTHLLEAPNSALYCIDTFEAETLEDFTKNISLTGRSDIVHLHIGESQYALCELVQAGITCDFVYIDGSHKSQDVLTDSVLSWLLLRSGGLMIFDDYLWSWPGNTTLDNPKIGIDSFVNSFSSEIRILNTPQNYQLCLLKV